MGAPTNLRRRFSMLDSLILVAAAAATLAIHRYIGDDVWDRRTRWYKIQDDYGMPTWMRWKERTIWTLAVLSPLALTAPPTLLAIRLLPPRAPRRRWTTQAGPSACIAATVAVGAHVAMIALEEWRTVGPHENLFHFNLVTWLEYPSWDVGLAVAAVWSTLALGNRLRCESTWIDRAGRLVGVYFLACLAVWILPQH